MSEVTPGRTRSALQDPRVIAAANDNPDAHAACELASAALRRAVERLATTA